MTTRFFISNARLKLEKKKKQMLSNKHTEDELLLFENYPH